MAEKITDVGTFFEELEGGVVERYLGTVLSEIAAKAVDTNKTGKIKMELEIKPIGNGNHVVTVKHKIIAVKPSQRGKTTEEFAGATSMHVGTGGSMSFFPENQADMFKQKQS